MAVALKKIESELMKLSPRTRARLIKRLLSSLDGDPESDSEESWVAEATHAETKSFIAARLKAYRLKRFSRRLAQRFAEKTNGSEAEIRIRPRGRHTLH